ETWTTVYETRTACALPSRGHFCLVGNQARWWGAANSSVIFRTIAMSKWRKIDRGWGNLKFAALPHIRASKSRCSGADCVLVKELMARGQVFAWIKRRSMAG